MSLRRILCTIAALVSLASGGAQAEVVTFRFTGTIIDGAPMAVLTGTQIVGTFAYDTDTPPSTFDKGYALYQFPAPYEITATVGGHRIAAGGLHSELYNHAKGNVEDMIWITGGPVVLDGTNFPEGVFGFVLASAPHNNKALRGTKLPEAYKLEDFDAGPNYTYGVLQMNGGSDGGLLQFSIDSIVVVVKSAP